MKRMFGLILALLLLALCVTGCAKIKPSVIAKVVDEGLPLAEMEHPPFLLLVCNGQAVQAKSPRCQWNRPDGTAIYADGPFVFDLWLGGDMGPLTIRPGDTVEFRFGCAPDRFNVTAWKAECATYDRNLLEDKIDLPVTDGTFTLPADGAYLYEISAEWDKQGKVSGDASYAFATDIPADEAGK
ncbi:MAG: hypothetical protein IK132_09935 [Clostridia bacterium]|nr:hypothetical protein [Clostridia bacterium]